MTKFSASSVVIGVLYAVLLCVLVALLAVARQQSLRLDGSAAQANWQDWREEARRQQAGNGPVARRVPRSSEPPSLVLLRDHFATSLTIVLVLSSALYFTIAMMVRGVLVGPQFHPDLAQDGEPTGT